MEKTYIPDGLTSSEVAKKYNLPRTTAWRAVKRGWFYGPDYHRIDSDPVKKSISNRFIEIAENPAICIRQLRILPEQKIIDIRSKKSTLRENDLVPFREEMTELRNLIRKFTHAPTLESQKKAMMTIFQEPRIHHYVLFGNRNMIQRIQTGGDPHDYEIDDAKLKASTLYRSLKI